MGCWIKLSDYESLNYYTAREGSLLSELSTRFQTRYENVSQDIQLIITSLSLPKVGLRIKQAEKR
jgi:hypothetical protein